MKINIQNQIFGDLEADIMDIMWDIKKGSVRDVLNRLSKKRKVAYTTVMTVMSRLFDKGFLKRRQSQNGAYIYHVSQSRDKFLENMSKKIIKNLIDEFGDVAVAQFFNIIEARDVKNIKYLRRSLKKIKQ